MALEAEAQRRTGQVFLTSRAFFVFDSVFVPVCVYTGDGGTNCVVDLCFGLKAS